jgi:2-octaprenyl-6-methoxyphenol hydroxylase
MSRTAWRIGVVGAGPVGLALALHAARLLPFARITVFDARAADRDVASDPRTLALARGSLLLLERLGLDVTALAAESITHVHVSQQQPAWPGRAAQPAVLLDAAELGVPRLGAVLAYGALLAPLQRAWLAAVVAEPARLAMRFEAPVNALKPLADGVEVDAGVAETFDIAVLAEGGVFGEQPRKAISLGYRQTAWVGELLMQGMATGLAIERFTPAGPLALLPLPARADTPSGSQRAALVWCVDAGDDPVPALSPAQRLAVLAASLPAEAGRPVACSELKSFALGLNAEPSLVEGRIVRIGNAAQTLHPVAGQGLNLGLRDAHALVLALRDSADAESALRRVQWARAPDRWSTMASTDFLARSFAWPGPAAAAARGLGLLALHKLPPLKALLARQMMYGLR